MELNNYQKQVMRDLSAYLDCVNRGTNLFSAWREYWFSKDVAVGLGGVPSYNNSIERAPHVCMKVPTGGGKTFMACASVRRIFDALPTGKPQVVVWLVPSVSILTQTIRTLSDVDHPYQQRLDQDFAGRVGVYTKEMLLNGQNFSPDTVREMLTVCVMSYGSLRIDSRKKDVRKVYQENGNLFRFAEYFKDTQALLADTPDTALIQVLRHLEPIVVVDESHNAESKLSTEMLNNLNPSFVLDLTATPRKNSNIISYVDARELKKEHMVKLPVVVYNRTTRQSVIQDAIQLRGSIEQEAIAAEAVGGKYIRPIVLFQAQPRTGDNSDTFDKIKAMLVGMGIPKNQIAVKTSDVDDLKGQNLMSRDCEIRYIITVNALKEGWDCPFAYILASLANRTSTVDVEQILGRILRQPYAMHKFDGFGDYACISAALPSTGGAISPVGIYYSNENNYFVAYKGRAPQLSEFPTYIAPRIIESEYWKEFSDTHHENCAGCKEIAEIVSGAKSGRNQAQWKMITMLHYIYTMFETSA